MPTSINVVEHHAVALPDHLNNSRTKKQLYRAGHTRLGPALRLDGDRLVALGLVGLVSTSKVQVQILPKIYNDDQRAMTTGLQYLQAMFPIALADQFEFKHAFAAKSSSRLLDYVLAFFLRRLADLLEWEFPRRYFEISEIRDTIAGRVSLNSLARQSPGTLRGVLVRHAPLQADNTTSRLCKAVVTEALVRAHSAKVIWQARQSLLALEDVKTVPLTEELIERAKNEERDSSWQWLFALASLLTDEKTTKPWEAGDSLGLGVLFRLEHLFELSVRAAVRKGIERKHGGRVDKERLGHLLHSMEGKALLKLKPDLVVRTQHHTFVADVKWKTLRDPQNPIPAEDDAYQVLAYSQHINTSKCLLIYPSPLNDGKSVRVDRYNAFSGKVQFGVIQVDPMHLVHDDRSIRTTAEDQLADALLSL